MTESLSYAEFLKIFERQHEHNESKGKNMDQTMEAEFEKEMVEEDEGETTAEEQEEEKTAEDYIRKLCRVCGGRGQISIFSTICDKYLTIQRSRYAKTLKEDVLISTMIAEICSEEVIESDGLPEFICIHCLGYLQHAYNMRLAVKVTCDNFREIRRIAAEEKIQLDEISRPGIQSANQKEIQTQKEELEEEKFWHETFETKNAKIKLSTKPPKSENRLVEMKCPGCFQRSYSAKSHNFHMKSCIGVALNRYFSEFKALFTNRFNRRITEHEYFIYAISLLFNFVEKIKVIANKNKIDIEAVCGNEPPEDVLIEKPPSQPSTFSTNSFDRQRPGPSNNRFSSPDYGYGSTN